MKKLLFALLAAALLCIPLTGCAPADVPQQDASSTVAVTTAVPQTTAEVITETTAKPAKPERQRLRLMYNSITKSYAVRGTIS